MHLLVLDNDVLGSIICALPSVCVQLTPLAPRPMNLSQNVFMHLY